MRRKLLDQTLDEEANADKLLTKLADRWHVPQWKSTRRRPSRN